MSDEYDRRKDSIGSYYAALAAKKARGDAHWPISKSKQSQDSRPAEPGKASPSPVRQQKRVSTMTQTETTGFGRIFPPPDQLARMPEIMQREALLLARESGIVDNVVSLPTTKSGVTHPPLPADNIGLGTADIGDAIGLDLATILDGRLLIQGTSGAGKSWTLRRLLEQTHGRIQQIIIDPEGEFRSLGESYGHLLIEAHKLDAHAAALAAARAREHRLSVLLDLSDLEREAQMRIVTAFLNGLIEAPADHWHPAIVAIDEAHLFAPIGGIAAAPDTVKRASVGAVTDLVSRGRKRGLGSVLATQRLARMAKSVASEFLNFLVGLNTLDLDIRRAAETIGWDARRAFDRLPMLEAGDFVAVGPAFNRSPAVLKVGGVKTVHRGSRPALTAPESIEPKTAAKLLDLEALVEASKGDSEIRDERMLPATARAVREFVRQPGFAAAGPVIAALQPLAPEGARVKELGDHLSIGTVELTATLALLDQFGIVDFSGDGADRAVRLERGMVT